MKYEIYFHGLICFYNSVRRYEARDPKTHALIVPAEHHLRSISTVDGAHLIEDWDSISLSLSPGDASTGPRFQNFVPHLGDSAVTRSSFLPVPAKAISLRLANGNLDVAQFYTSYVGQFDLDYSQVIRPVGRISLLTIVTDQVLSITTQKNKVNQTITVPPDSWALIFNSPTPQHHPDTSPDNHFRYYSKISYAEDENEVASVTDVDRPVTDDRRGDNVDAVVDVLARYGPLTQTQCSNSQWP